MGTDIQRESRYPTRKCDGWHYVGTSSMAIGTTKFPRGEVDKFIFLQNLTTQAATARNDNVFRPLRAPPPTSALATAKPLPTAAWRSMHHSVAEHPALPRLLDDLLNPPHFTGGQANFDAMGVMRRIGQYLLDHASGSMAGSLVLLQDDVHDETRLDVFSVLAAQDANSSLGYRATVRVALPGASHN